MSRAALNYFCETWVLNQKGTQKLEVSQIHSLRPPKNSDIRERQEDSNIVEIKGYQ
jgi:hypothetical protein